MSRKKGIVHAVAMLVALSGLMLAISAPAIAGDGEAESIKKVKKIKIKKMTPCEGEDCSEAAHRMIIEKHGDLDEIHAECEGEECEEKIRVLVGKHGDMPKIHTMPGHRKVWTWEECQGEECGQEHRIVVRRKGGGLHEIHRGGDDFLWVGKGAGMHHAEWFGGGKRGFLGVQLVDLTDELRQHFGAPAGTGVMIGKVLEESAAESAGLEVGDIVISIDGETVSSAGALSSAVWSREGGVSVDLEISRQGLAQTVTAVLGEREVSYPHGAHRMIVVCEDGDEDCEADFGSFDCGGAEECEVRVECGDEECTCTANGEAIDCAELDLPHHHFDK